MPYLQIIDGVVTGYAVCAQPSIEGFVLVAANDARIAAFFSQARTTITFNEFLARFTPTERGAIFSAALQSAQLLQWMTQGAAAGGVPLLDPDTAAGMDALVGAGIITSNRKAEILTP